MLHASKRRPLKFRKDRGAVVIMMSLMIVPLCIVTATVVDLGFVRVQRSSLQNAADAAAVAAANMLSAAGSGQPKNDGLPQAACVQALASLRQNISGFASTDVDDTGGCAGNLPALVSGCIASGAASSVTLQAESGDVTAELTYPAPAGADKAGERVTYVRSGAEINDPASPEARCRAMLVTVDRDKIGPFFTGMFNGTGQSVSARSLGAHRDPGFTEETVPPTTAGPTTSTSTTTTTLPPNVGANFVMQHNFSGSNCTGRYNAPYFVPNLSIPHADILSMFGCPFPDFRWIHNQIWTAYGVGSNGTGTVVMVGDQDRFARFTGCSSSPSLGPGDIHQATEGWVGGGSNIFYDVTGVGSHWVAVGSGGSVRISNDDGRSWHNAATKPSTVSWLTEVATDGNGTWIAASNMPGLPFRLYRSTDNGEHWSTILDGAFSNPVPSELAQMRSVAWSPTEAKWLATGSFGRVWQSADGSSWQAIPGVRLNDSGGLGDDLISITVSPTGTVLVAAGGLGKVYRATTSAGPYTSSGKQIPWAMTPKRVRFGPNGTAMVTGSASLIYYSQDDGVTWTKLTSGVPVLRTWSDLASCTIGGV